ncbi:MAG: iron-containing alcohol dehydrogenase [Oscillospiraceae bacterium]|jgi:alcohol dehydrogenase class IV|nr:iron-containing alcohol dehydrogenase [Oscillospiraceae bacterium]
MTVKQLYYRTFQGVMKYAVVGFDWKQPELLTGAGSVKELPAYVKAHGARKVLLVTGSGLAKLGLPNGLMEALEQMGIGVSLFSEVLPNPTIPVIENAVEQYKRDNCDTIVAFGGGSPMDCAKVVGARIAKPNKQIPDLRGVLRVGFADAVLRRKPSGFPPLYAVPTTAGTGSETTVAAIVSNPETHEKFPINDPALRPRAAVLDPELTVGLPKHITSTTGMDALTHAVEAFIGRSNTKDTEAKALEATTLIFGNLEKVYENGADIEARQNMLIASFYAGVAFTRAYVGYVHAIAHNLGGLYNVPHGLANAIILPHMLEWYGDAAVPRLAKLAEAAGILGATDAEKAHEFILAIKQMNASMDIPEKLDCIRAEDIPTLADRALAEGNPLYPVPKLMDKPQCEAFIQSLMA